jgi:uroporphyrinogen decarboxylase
MNSRQRVETTLNHQEPDRIPCDLGSVVMSSLHLAAYRNLRRYLRLPEVDIRLADTVQQLVQVDDDVRERFGADVRGVNPQPSQRASKIVISDEWPEYRHFYDEWGIGWKMPKEGGFYYDVFHHPLQGDVTCADIERHPWPDPTDPQRFVGLRERAKQAAEAGEAVIVPTMCAGFVEMAGWMRGYQDYLMDMADSEARLECFFDKILELKMAYWERALAEVGDYATAVLESDDLGSQRDLLFSPKAYRKLVKPRHRQLYQFIKSRTRAKLFLHSCGAIRKVLPDLIEVGVDILNPVQVNCAGMDSRELKREFGKDLTFWGGGVDTQYVLGTGSVQDVCDEVRRRIDDLAPGGGFVFTTVHAIQANVPPENVVAVFDTLAEYGVYPAKPPADTQRETS